MKITRYSSLPLILSYGAEAFQCQPSRLPTASRRTTTVRHVSLSSDHSQGLYRNDDNNNNDNLPSKMNPIQSTITKITMISYIASMCVALPVSLLPVALLRQANFVSKTQSEHLALQTAESCARFLLLLMPFVNLDTISYQDPNPQPSIWVANHVSQIDTFLFLANDAKLRGPSKRPIKTVYWQGLDANPVTKLLFHMAGFIPVQMADNGSGNDNEYDPKSFKQMLKMVKQAFDDGFDVFLLPEGQLNPTPEQGLLPVYPGAYSLAKLSHRPIRWVALHGSHQLWHADDNIGMTVTGNDVSMRSYPPMARQLESKEEFIDALHAIVGHFAATGEDLPTEELDYWLGLNQDS